MWCQTWRRRAGAADGAGTGTGKRASPYYDHRLAVTKVAQDPHSLHGSPWQQKVHVNSRLHHQARGCGSLATLARVYPTGYREALARSKAHSQRQPAYIAPARDPRATRAEPSQQHEGARRRPSQQGPHPTMAQPGALGAARGSTTSAWGPENEAIYTKLSFSQAHQRQAANHNPLEPAEAGLHRTPSLAEADTAVRQKEEEQQSSRKPGTPRKVRQHGQRGRAACCTRGRPASVHPPATAQNHTPTLPLNLATGPSQQRRCFRSPTWGACADVFTTGG